MFLISTAGQGTTSTQNITLCHFLFKIEHCTVFFQKPLPPAAYFWHAQNNQDFHLPKIHNVSSYKRPELKVRKEQLHVERKAKPVIPTFYKEVGRSRKKLW